MAERDARRKEAELAWREKQRELWCQEEDLSPRTKEEINNVRTKLFWIYQTRDPKEFKVRYNKYFPWIIQKDGGIEEAILTIIIINIKDINRFDVVYCLLS